MADDSRLVPDSFDDLPRRVRGVNYRVPPQAGRAPEFARFQPPPALAGGQLPKRVPGTSAFRASPRLARVRSLPVAAPEAESAPTVPLAAVTPGGPIPRAVPRPQASTLPMRAKVPTAPAASPPLAKQSPALAGQPRKPARSRARRWWLVGLLIVILAAAAVFAASML